MRILGAMLTVLLVVPAGVRAQTSSLWSEIHDPVGHAATSPLREAANRGAARFAETLVPRSTQQAPRRRHWVARHPVLLGALVGTGVTLGYIAANPCAQGVTCQRDPASSGVDIDGLFVGAGAAMGAVVEIIFLR
jgi:hypothetical protein